MNEADFEWDDAKAAANLAKHKISFETARRAFSDVFAVEREGDTEDYVEPRYSLLGVVDGKIIFVSFTMRGGV
jgi:uncharacterized DUF497 family protein